MILLLIIAFTFRNIAAFDADATSYELVNRIINGDDANIRNFPHQVSLQYNYVHFCSGSILNKNTILTAAHCLEGLKEKSITVAVGSSKYSNGCKFKPDKFYFHPKYKIVAQVNFDLAIIKLDKNLNFSDYIQPIALQPASAKIPEETLATISGWGNRWDDDIFGSRNLQWGTVYVISNEKCKTLIDLDDGWEITPQMLCTWNSHQGTCAGDSGGPLVANKKLIGIVSWGMPICDPKYPGVYANISAMRDFIDKYM